MLADVAAGVDRHRAFAAGQRLASPTCLTCGSMPEGHTLHRIGRLHHDVFSGGPVAMSSPQGRFATGAAALNGKPLRSVQAYGKHLFYRWEGAPDLYVHLGLIGKFTTWHDGTAPAPTPGTRLAMTNHAATSYLSGPMACRLLEPGEEETIVGKLGPDPIASRRGAGSSPLGSPASAVRSEPPCSIRA